jgi:hypothetical protein
MSQVPSTGLIFEKHLLLKANRIGLYKNNSLLWCLCNSIDSVNILAQCF